MGRVGGMGHGPLTLERVRAALEGTEGNLTPERAAELVGTSPDKLANALQEWAGYILGVRVVRGGNGRGVVAFRRERKSCPDWHGPTQEQCLARLAELGHAWTSQHPTRADATSDASRPEPRTEPEPGARLEPADQ